MGQVIVKGVAYDGGCAEVRFGRLALAFSSIDYGHSVEREEVKRVGQQKISALTPGEYKVEKGSVSFEWASYTQLIEALAASSGAAGFSSVAWGIHIDLSHPDIGTCKDTILECFWSGVKKKIEAGNKALMAEMAFQYKQVLENGHAPNRLRGPVGGGRANI